MENQKTTRELVIAIATEYNQLSAEERNYLKFMPYGKFLNSSYWKAIREIVLLKHNYKCYECHSEILLHVHHKSYEHRGEEHCHLADLTVLCLPCHYKLHKKLLRCEKYEKTRLKIEIVRIIKKTS